MAPGLLKSDGSSISSSESSSDAQVPINHDGVPIAIVGMGCRLPGESDTPDAFWEMLLKNRKCYSEPPKSRFNIDGFHSTKSRPGSLRPRGAYFISDTMFDFDAPFFGITKPEAEAMDPQQRKLLECVFEAFENSGISLDSISGTNTAVYVANFNYDYGVMNLKDGDYPQPYSMTGQGVTILSNRISYVYNLKGPSFTLDTACSSSIYAAHQACRALAHGETDGALVCGSNLIQSVEVHMGTDKMGVLSPTSTCHTFDASADGYGRGEGIGVMYLKRLSDALRDGDPVRGIIRGSAVNANGKTSGITQPSAAGQEAVVRAAYKWSGLSLDDTSYFETHGTGTAVGDPIELTGITNTFLPPGTSRKSLLVGGVKPNIGHGEAVSAIASMIKVAYALESGIIPGTIGINKFNPKIDFRDGKLEVVQENRQWPTSYPVRRASVNSFGYGGANGHVIMESAESMLPGYQSFKNRETSKLDSDVEVAAITGTMGSGKVTYKTRRRTQFLLPFSAHDVPTLKANIENVRQVADEYDVEDLAYTLSARRSRFFNRGFATVDANAVSDDLEEQSVTLGKRGGGTQIALVFTGQGSQSAQMGKDLMQDFPSYLKTIRDLDAILQSLGPYAPDWSIERELLVPKATSSIDQVHLSQPLCTAVQIALVDMLRAWKITPVATVGHSSGAIAAAYASGSITKRQAIIYAFFRGVAVQRLTARGTMLAVGLREAEVEPYLEEGIVVACYNSASSVTLSGDEEAASRVQAKLEKDKVFVRALKTSGRAYHSHHMKLVGDSYADSLERALRLYGLDEAGLKSAAQRSVYSSSVHGVIMPDTFKPGPDYWRQNLESPVRFSQALEALLLDETLKINTVIEVGPHSALAGPIRQIRDGLGKSSKDIEYFSCLVRGENATTRLLDLAGSLFVKGYDVDLAAVNAIERESGGTIERIHGKVLVDLPRYAWNYSNGKNLRSENRINREHRLRKYPRHELLGAKLPGSLKDDTLWRNMLDVADLPWLMDHKLGNEPVLPAMGFLAIATEAARQFHAEFQDLPQSFCYSFPHVTVKAALKFPSAGTAIEVMTSMQFSRISDSISSSKLAEFSIRSHFNGIWTEHAIGSVEIQPASQTVEPLFDEQQLQEPKTAHTWYRGFSSIDLNYGAAFNGLSDIRTDPWRTQATALSELVPSSTKDNDPAYLVHPGTLDTCMQAILIAAHNGSLRDLKESFIPVSMENVTIWSHSGSQLPPVKESTGSVLATGMRSSLRALSGAVQLFDEQKAPIFAAEKVNSISYAEALSTDSSSDRHPYLRVIWKPDVDLARGSITAKNNDSGLLRMWAEGLVHAANEHPDQPLSKAILQNLKRTDEESTSPGEPIAQDLTSLIANSNIHTLESFYLSALVRVQNKTQVLEKVPSLPSVSLSTTLDLLVHKQPGMNVAFFACSNESLELIASVLGGKSSLKRYRTLSLITRTADSVPDLIEKFSDFHQISVFDYGSMGSDNTSQYDLAVIPKSFFLQDSTNHHVSLKSKIGTDCRLLMHGDGTIPDNSLATMLDAIKSNVSGYDWPASPEAESGMAELRQDAYTIHTVQDDPSGWTVLTAKSEKNGEDPPITDVTILSRNERDDRAVAFAEAFENAGFNVVHATLNDPTFRAMNKAMYVSTIEFRDNLFETLTTTELANLQSIAESATAVFWTTTGNLLNNTNAHAATVMGLGRTLQTEYPLLHFFTIDLDHTDPQLGAEQVFSIVKRFNTGNGEVDKEYIIKDGIPHVSRLSEDLSLDESHRQKAAGESGRRLPSSTQPVHLAIDKVGILDTLQFVKDERSTELSDGQVEVIVKSVGVNMKEFATFRGTFNSESLSHEGAGIVSRVAPGTTDVAVGDRVAWMGKGKFGNVERFSAIHVHKIPDTSTFEEMASMPLAFSTAVYGLLHLGRLRKGEKVLIHSATGGVGLAALQIARMVGAEIFVTVGTSDKRQFVKEHYGLDDAHIFNSRDTEFAQKIMENTDGCGIDVCLNSLVRELLRASWSIMASNGRHIEIGRTDILDYGKLDLNVFKRNTTFSAFDFGVVADEHPEIPAQVMREVMEYYREGKIQPLTPLYQYSAAEITEAMNQFGNGDRTGKVVVNFDDKPIKVKNESESAKFRNDGTYLLVGCLGGLGRCLARWMVEQGARNLTFLGRSGADSKEATAFVSSLEARGVAVHVVRGDVSIKADVERAVAASAVPVYGMVQGAMALEDRLFRSLDLKGWNYAVDPKVKGTLNLHDALTGQPLDFFVMISSISAMTGAPTQSNYCAANTFLDFFARQRTQQGLPATTVGLSMVLEVGFVSQNETIEHGIARSGIHGINEKEFIDLMATAMSPAPEPSWTMDNDANHFLVSGLEPSKLASDLDVNSFRYWKQPRIGPLAVSIEARNMTSGGATATAAKSDQPAIEEAVVAKFAKTFMIPVDDIEESKPLVAFGMDSMIGIALRNWVFSTYQVDVPTSDFMGPLLTAEILAEKIFSGMSR
ncbi:ketoacyl-synt-domain-containing protein [Aureobasidium pullulans]|nr:ketoacyl-synt-domain-containing protein [Aureobasidium pullulans]